MTQPVFQTDIGTLRVESVNPQTDPRWISFVAAHPDGLIYHHPAWLQVLEEVYRYQALCLVCEDGDGQMRGILPLVYTRGLFTGRGLSSLPRTPYAGGLAHDRETMVALLQAAVDRVRNEPGAQLQLKVSSATYDGMVDDVVGTPWELMYMLELPKQSEQLRFGNTRNHGRIKWAINKATRLGVQVRPAEDERDLRAWYELYLHTMRWHAVPPRPYRFFKVCWELLQPRGLMRLLLAEQHVDGQCKLLAGSIFLMFGQTVLYAFNGRRREDLGLHPNDVIQWCAIHDACKAGFQRYDFGEVANNHEGLATFKSKWNAEPRQLYKYRYPRRQITSPSDAEAGNYRRQVANAVWRRLPLKATALLGDWIFSYL